MPLKSILPDFHEQRTTKSNSRAALAEKSLNIASAASTRPRLRRVQAFADLVKPTPSTARTVSITVKKKAWLKEAVALTRCMSMMDKENIDPLVRLPSVETITSTSEFSFVDELCIPAPKRTRSTLHRKHKSIDLRSQYSGRRTSDISEDSDITMSSIDTTVHESEAHCVCGVESDFAFGGMVHCEICMKLFHRSCVGQGYPGVQFAKESVFYCSDCEQAAFCEIAAHDS